MAPVNVTIVLAPDRRRAAASMLQLFDVIARSDAKKYASGKPFLPIFPTDNQPLQAAIQTVVTQLQEVLGFGE